MYLVMSFLIAAAATDRPVVDVFLPNVIDRNVYRAFGRARGVVQDAYGEIGIRVAWHFGNATPLRCEKHGGHRQVVVEFRYGPKTGRSSDAMAFANPYPHEGACVTLLMDRLQDEVTRDSETTGLLLGHVLAHEIGHVLQGIDRHSEVGLMKEKWSRREISAMWRAPLRFTEVDAELMLEPFKAAVSARVGALRE